MKDHIKYRSIENHYLTKHVNYNLARFKSELEVTSWCAQEKINGANISFLFRYAKLSKLSKFNEFGLKTLNKMANGGIFDQIGGGFHRYSTDAKWLVPHFEKMLYDNALIPVNYTEAYQITKVSRATTMTKGTK